MTTIREYIRLLRFSHWIKNGFIFAPLFFSFEFPVDDIINTSIGFILFSLTASSLYIFNDFMDIKEDRLHPIKKNRPLASGSLNPKHAILLMGGLFITSFTGAWLLNQNFFIVMGIYALLNISYSLWFKEISILDISIIAIGFILRIFAGAVLINVHPTNWIVLATFFLALFLALSKRRDDVILNSDGVRTRKSIDGYNLELINAGMVCVAAVTSVVYIMYTISDEVIIRFGSDNLYLTSFLVIIGLLRYMQIAYVDEKSGNPVTILYKDFFIKIVITAWLFSLVLIYYL